MENELEAILSKTRKLYYTYGIRSVTMDDVAKELGISKKTLYQHIKDKEDLVRKIMLSEFEQVSKKFASVIDDSLNAIEQRFQIHKFVFEIIKNYNPRIGYDLKKYHLSVYNEMTKCRRFHIYESILENLKKGKQQGLFRAEINEEIIAKLPVLRMEGKLIDDFFSFDNFSPTEVFHELFLYNLYAICNAKGRKLLTIYLQQLNTKANEK